MLEMLGMFLDSGMGEIAQSPFIVPVAGCIMIVGIIGFQAWGGVRRREMESQERLAAIAKGIPLPMPPVESVATQAVQATPSLKRRYANVRLAGVILVCGGFGLILFFVIMGVVLQVRPLYGVAGAGLIPLGIGVGMLIDAQQQKRELDETSAAMAAESSIALRSID